MLHRQTREELLTLSCGMLVDEIEECWDEERRLLDMLEACEKRVEEYAKDAVAVTRKVEELEAKVARGKRAIQEMHDWYGSELASDRITEMVWAWADLDDYRTQKGIH